MAIKTKIKKIGFERKPGFVYFIDGDGDISRSKRGVKGSKRKMKKVGVKRPKGYLLFLDSDGDISKVKMKRR